MLKTNGKYISVKEASLLTGKSVTIIYRKIKSGQLGVKTVLNSGKNVLNVREADLAKVFGMNDKTGFKQYDKTVLNTDKTVLTEDKFKSIMEEFFQEKETRLMKPLEEIATYKLGKVEAKNQFLKERLETVIQENEELRETIKALPGPVKEINTKLQEQKTTIVTQEKALIQLEEDKTNLVKKSELKEQEIEKLKETVKNQAREKSELEKAKEAELEALKEKLKEEQEEKERLAVIWTKELEEERNRPWWKKIFG